MNKPSNAIFSGRKLVIATMHGKEKVIAPLLEKALGVETLLPEGFNTDRYGTFSGEIEREKDPLETASTKCLDACRMTGCTLAVASEGSFGAHPTIFFIPADDEIMVFMDLENDIYVRARVVSPKTNFGGNKFTDWPNAVKFVHASGFPAHGLILRGPQQSDPLKGIQDWKVLETNFETRLKNYGEVFLATDMRALYNPTRMEVIAKVAEKLVEILLHTCPKCQFPGFDVAEVKPGLPCSHCGLQTNTTLAHLYKCKKCRHTHLKLYPHGTKTEDPQYCDFCNP